MGVHLLKPLFFEHIKDSTEKHLVLYTTKDYDHTVEIDGAMVTLPSIKRLFVELEDFTEYEFANLYFDNFQHWKKIRACSWFAPLYLEMKEELTLKVRARHFKKVRELVDDEKLGLQATKYLLENEVGVKEDTRGRPSKKKIEEEASKMLGDVQAINEDFERLGIKLDG
jgi:hypothetical protein